MTRNKKMEEFFEKVLLDNYGPCSSQPGLDIWLTCRGEYGISGCFEFEEDSRYYDGEFELIDKTLEKVLSHGSMRILVKCRDHNNDEEMEDGSLLAPFLPEEIVEIPIFQF